MSRGATSSSTTLLPPFYPTTDDPPEVERASALWSRCNEPGNEHWRSEARWLKEGWLPSLSETGATCLKSKNTWRTKRLQRLLAAARSARLDPNKSTPRAALARAECEESGVLRRTLQMGMGDGELCDVEYTYPYEQRRAGESKGSRLLRIRRNSQAMLRARRKAIEQARKTYDCERVIADADDGSDSDAESDGGGASLDAGGDGADSDGARSDSADGGVDGDGAHNDGARARSMNAAPTAFHYDGQTTAKQPCVGEALTARFAKAWRDLSPAAIAEKRRAACERNPNYGVTAILETGLGLDFFDDDCGARTYGGGDARRTPAAGKQRRAASEARIFVSPRAPDDPGTELDAPVEVKGPPKPYRIHS